MSIIQDIVINMLNSEHIFYGYLIQNMRFVKNDKQPTLAITGKDGQVTMHYNENWLKSLTPDEQMASIEHEILHIANNHNERFAGRESDKFQGPYLIGTDCAINQLIPDMPKICIQPKNVEDILKKHGIIKGPLELNREAELYVNYLKQVVEKNKEDLEKGEAGQGCNHFDYSDDEKGMGDLEKELFKQQCIEAGKQAGSTPAGIDKLIEEWTRIAKLNWKQLLKINCMKSIKAEKHYSWKRLRRRSEFEVKGLVYDYKPKIVVAIDTSGSIYGSPGILEEFIGQLNNIRESSGHDIDVIECDAAIQKEYKLKRGIQVQKNFKGGGGTDFRPVFDMCERKYNPGILVYLTDGEGSFPSKAPQFKTIWCSIYNNEQSFPFGKFIHLDINDKY